jgi:hypothetical protein
METMAFSGVRQIKSNERMSFLQVFVLKEFPIQVEQIFPEWT